MESLLYLPVWLASRDLLQVKFCWVSPKNLREKLVEFRAILLLVTDSGEISVCSLDQNRLHFIGPLKITRDFLGKKYMTLKIIADQTVWSNLAFVTFGYRRKKYGE